MFSRLAQEWIQHYLNESDTTIIYAGIGTIVVRNDHLHLAVETPCLLDSSKLTFREAIERDLPLAVTSPHEPAQIVPIPSPFTSYRVDLPPVALSLTSPDLNELNLAVNSLNTGHNGSECRWFQHTILDEVLLYVPHSHYHIRLRCVRRKPILPELALGEVASLKPSPPAVSCCVRTTVHPYSYTHQFYPSAQFLVLFSSHAEVPLEGDPSAQNVDQTPTQLRFQLDPEVLKRSSPPEELEKSMILLAECTQQFIRSRIGKSPVIAAQFERLASYVDLSDSFTDQVRRHYDQKKIESAEDSCLEGMRRINNLVKRKLIQFACESISHKKVTVLDLACGHGQDINKYIDCQAERYVGIDISSNEIDMGKERFKTRGQEMAISLMQGDVQSPEAFMLIEGHLFDVVSMQLAIHYCVATEEQARALLLRVKDHLAPNGLFICSSGSHLVILDGLLNAKVLPDGDFVFGNKFCRVRFDQSTLQSLLGCTKLHSSEDLIPFEARLKHLFATTWGIKYHFRLVGHIDAEEYVLPWSAFKAIAESIGLSLVYEKNFREIFNQAMMNPEEFERLNKTLKNRCVEDIEEPELKVVEFYTAFAFKRDAPMSSANPTPIEDPPRTPPRQSHLSALPSELAKSSPTTFFTHGSPALTESQSRQGESPEHTHSTLSRTASHNASASSASSSSSLPGEEFL